MELQERLPEFEALGYDVVALSQEDSELGKAMTIVDDLDPLPTYPIAIDLDRAATARYARTTVYLVDGDGIVVEVMPMLTHMRASASAILDRARRRL